MHLAIDLEKETRGALGASLSKNIKFSQNNLLAFLYAIYHKPYLKDKNK